MNSEYLIQIPLRDKNATLFKYIQVSNITVSILIKCKYELISHN